MKYKIEIDRNGCIACATCYMIDPSHFESDPDGKSKVVGGVSNGRSTGTFDDSKNEDAQMAGRQQLSCERHNGNPNITQFVRHSKRERIVARLTVDKAATVHS